MAEEHYQHVVVETYRAIGEASGSDVRVRPLPGQQYPVDMHVECSKGMRKSHPIGTKFKIMAKVKNKEGGPDFLYSSYRWDYDVLSDDQAEKFIKSLR